MDASGRIDKILPVPLRRSEKRKLGFFPGESVGERGPSITRSELDVIKA